MESGRSNLEMIKRVCNFALDTLFPIECLGCKKEGEWVCGVCAKKIPLSIQTSCFVCKKTSLGGGTCFDCQKSFPVTRLLRFFDYDEPIVKDGIRIAKYSYVKNIFECFLEIVAPHAGSMLEGHDIDLRALIFIPVPLHPRRMRERGFNQAELIAARIARACGAAYVPALIRTRYTLPQADLNEEDRNVNIKRAFFCRDRAGTDNRYAVLVDDVATTGSTLSECARILRQSGAREVWALTLAKG